MPTFLLYSLKAAGCLAVFYLFYKLLLSRDTLHRMNRVLLCGVLLLSFLLPLCVITVEKELPGVSAAGIDVIPENYFRRDMVFENRIPDDTRDLMIIEEPEPAPEPFDWGVLLGIIYFAGMFADRMQHRAGCANDAPRPAHTAWKRERFGVVGPDSSSVQLDEIRGDVRGGLCLRRRDDPRA